MIKISVTLVYEDTSTWFVGEFASQEAADVWINAEKTRPYWNEATQVQTETITIEDPV